MATAFFISPRSTSSGGATERYFVYDPNGVAAGNVYTDWATMFAAIALLPIGEKPVVSVVGAGTPHVVPLAGMPATGWNMRGGSIVSFYDVTQTAALDIPAGVMFDMLLEVGDGIGMTVDPPAGTGVLNFTDIPDDGVFLFIIGRNVLVLNTGAGALIRSRGAATIGTYALLLSQCQMGALFAPASTGPLIDLVGDDAAAISFSATFGGLPIAPAAGPVRGGGAASTLTVLADASATLPHEWSPDYTGGPPTIRNTSRNGLRGPTALRPTAAPLYVGTLYFDTTLGLPIWWDGTTWITAGGGMLLFGASNVAATTASRALWPSYDNGTAPLLASTVQFRAPRAGTLRNMRVRTTPAGNGNPIVYTVRVNGVNSLLSVSLASNVADGSDLANTVAVAAGDLLDVAVTKADSVGSSPTRITCTMEYV